MDLTSQVTLLGGVCTRRTLLTLRTPHEIDRALRTGLLVRDARGRYALPTTQPAIRTAHRVGGIVSHRSAAQYWGWAQKSPPPLPEVTFEHARVVPGRFRTILVPHWSDLPDHHVQGPVTTRERTLVDCMRNLPLDEALPIVNSAIRADDVTPGDVRALADSTKGRGRARIRAVAAVATGRSANAFEDVLHAQALLVPGLQVIPQLPVEVPHLSAPLHPDLGDPVRRIALEAEGFEWHGNPQQLTRDCRRYNLLGVLGWLVIRFSWRLVMYEPAYVHRVLLEAVARTDTRYANVASEADDHPTNHVRDICMPRVGPHATPDRPAERRGLSGSTGPN